MFKALCLACCLLLVDQVTSVVDDGYYRMFVPDPVLDVFSEQVKDIGYKLPCIRECLDMEDCKFVAFKEECKKDCCVLCISTGSPVSTLRSGFEYWKVLPEVVEPEPQIEAYTDYLFALTRGFKGTTAGPSYLIAWANTDTTIDVTVGTAAPTTHTAVANTPLHIAVSGTDRLIDTGVIENKGILVQSNNPIKLIVYNKQVDYMLPLPTTVLGTDYLAAGFTGSVYNSDQLSSMIAVVALNDGTSVTATLDGSTVFTTTLNARQTYTYITSSGDVTGTEITANKPISVMSGGDCLFVPLGQTYCDPLSSHILPRSSWGQTYVVVSMPPRTCGMLMRVMATVPNTVVTLNDGQTSTITTAEHWELDLTSSVGYTVDCSQKCMVWLINKGDCDSVDSDPFQIMVPSISMWPTVPMIVPYATGASRYLTIMTLTSAATQLTLNGNTVYGWNVIANSIYSWAHVTIATDDNTLDHPDPAVKVMAFMTDHSAGYAYGAPIGIAL